MKARVLILIKGLGIGGAERLIAESAAFWDRRSFDYSVAYVLPWKDQLVAALRAQDVEVVCIGGKRGSSPATALRLRRTIRDRQIDLVHAHLPSTGVMARMTSAVPVVYTEHNVAHSYREPTRTLNRLTYRRNRATIAVSDAVAESLAEYGQEIEVIPNGVSVAVTEEATDAVRSELGLSRTDPLVVHVGNIRPHKGHRNLLTAAGPVLARHSETTIVSVGGEKHPGDLAALRTAAVEAGVADRVHFLGRRSDALAFIAAADVVVNPSDHEGLPVALLEALALARPVAATAVGGVPSVVRPGETGLLVPAGDPSALADAVNRLLEDGEMASAMGKAGRALVEERHGLGTMVSEVESVYRRVLGGGAQ
ncbi:MAG TPA: glycosyltransferase [Acidimicrobiia bacterium]|nr:glycosyltransferase [Acidimicrobiia bacterium]